jgi:hypothetical protein
LASTAGSDTHDRTDLVTRFGRHGGAAEWLDELLALTGEALAEPLAPSAFGGHRDRVDQVAGGGEVPDGFGDKRLAQCQPVAGRTAVTDLPVRAARRQVQ